MVLVKRAMRLTFENEPEKPLWQIKHVTLEALQKSFKNKTWSEALKDSLPQSDLRRFLNDTCLIETDEHPNIDP